MGHSALTFNRSFCRSDASRHRIAYADSACTLRLVKIELSVYDARFFCHSKARCLSGTCLFLNFRRMYGATSVEIERGPVDSGDFVESNAMHRF
jgi:hypothetical protein